MKLKKVRRRKEHMNIIVCNDNDSFEVVHIPNNLAPDYILEFDLSCVPSKDDVFDFLLKHNSLKVKWKK